MFLIKGHIQKYVYIKLIIDTNGNNSQEEMFSVYKLLLLKFGKELNVFDGQSFFETFSICNS